MTYALAVPLAVSALVLALFSHPLSEALRRAFDITQTSDTAEVRTSLLSAALLAALFASAVFLMRLSAGWRRVAPLLLIGFIISDLAYHNRHINPLVPTSFFDRPALTMSHARPFRLYRENDVPRTLQRGNTEILRLARYARQSAYPLTGIGDGVFYLFDEDTLDIYPREYRRLCESLEKSSREDRVKILKTEGCQYYISHTRIHGLRAGELNANDGIVFVHELTGPAQRVRVVHNCVVASSPEEKLRVCLEPDFDPERMAIIDRPLVLEDMEPSAENESIEILESRQGVMRGRASLSRAGVIVFPGNFAAGWRASVDGRPVEVFRANLSSKGILIPAGRHEVNLRYLPRSFVIGAASSATSLLFLGAWILILALRRHRPKGPGCLAAVVFL